MSKKKDPTQEQDTEGALTLNEVEKIGRKSKDAGSDALDEAA